MIKNSEIKSSIYFSKRKKRKILYADYFYYVSVFIGYCLLGSIGYAGFPSSLASISFNYSSYFPSTRLASSLFSLI